MLVELKKTIKQQKLSSFVRNYMKVKVLHQITIFFIKIYKKGWNKMKAGKMSFISLTFTHEQG